MTIKNNSYIECLAFVTYCLNRDIPLEYLNREQFNRVYNQFKEEVKEQWAKKINNS